MKGAITMAKKSEMIGFKTTTEIKAALEQIAEIEDRTISYIINRILEDYLFGGNPKEIVTINFDKNMKKFNRELSE